MSRLFGAVFRHREVAAGNWHFRWLIDARVEGLTGVVRPLAY